MYIFASTKEWNKKAFELVKQRVSEDGIYVSNQQELDLALNNNSNKISWVFFAHWSAILPPHICSTINGVIFHCTDLPYGRGGSPLQNLIIRGHKTTKVSAIRLTKRLDAGNILLKTDLSLEGNASEIFEKMSLVISEQCYKILINDFKEEEQVGNPVFFKRRKPEESDLTANDFPSLENLYDFIRMLDCDGYPKAFLQLAEYRFEFFESNFTQTNQLECKVRIVKTN